MVLDRGAQAVYSTKGIWKEDSSGISQFDNTGQQNLTFFSAHELQKVNLAALFMLNSDMCTEYFYQAEFQRYRGLYLCKIVLYVLLKQAETYL